MTYVAHSCPCCGSTRHEEYPAVIAPFVASYALAQPPAPTRLLECEDCGFRFFQERLTDAEADRLYDGYRGDRYYEARHRHEPWYTRKVNDALGDDAVVVQARRELVERFVRDRIDLGKIEDVLDFGGDRGQLIPEGLGHRRYVYEISGKEPVPGVERIGSAEALKGRTFDLVMSCQVLEHCSEPRAVLEHLRSLLRSKDSVLYVELPYERIDLRWLGKGPVSRAYVGALRHVPPLLMAMDLYSTAVRLKLNAMPPLGVVKMHEHLNFFGERSLARLLELSGFDTFALERLVVRTRFGETPVLSALAHPRQPSA